jgi:hypothetical protein
MPELGNADCETITRRQVACEAKAESFIWHAGIRYHICTMRHRMLRKGTVLDFRKQKNVTAFP